MSNIKMLEGRTLAESIYKKLIHFYKEKKKVVCLYPCTVQILPENLNFEKCDENK